MNQTNTKVKIPEIKSTEVNTPPATPPATPAANVGTPETAAAVVFKEAARVVSERPLERDPRAADIYFVVRVKEEYLSREDGSHVTPYFKSAHRFQHLTEELLELARLVGGQIYKGYVNHATAKHLLLDLSVMY